MRRLSLIALALSAALLAPARPAAAQEPRATPAAKNLAVEIDGDPEHDYQIQVKGGLETSPLRRLPGWQRPAGAAPLTAVKIDTDYEGDAVRINLSVVFDDSSPADAPGPKYGRKVQAVASYRAREGESVRLEELARFGVEPMTLKVVQAKPRPAEPPPLAATPLVANNLKSVQVVGFHPDLSATARSNEYTLRLHNVSPKAVTALSLHDNGGTRLISLSSAARPLIPPGDVRDVSFNFNVNHGTTPRGYEHDADQQRALTVATAVFDDGTYEGDAEAAAKIVARRRGDEVQRARILTLLRAALDAPPPGTPDALAKLKAELSAMRIDADPAAVAELAARFPSLARDEAAKRAGRDAVAVLSSEMVSGLSSARESVLHTIGQWQEEGARAAGPFDLRARLAGLAERMERGGRR